MPGGCFSTQNTPTHLLHLLGWKAPSGRTLDLPLQGSKWPHLTPHPHSTLTQLSWWKSVLSCPPMKCCLTPLLTINLDIYIDVLTSWGIGICAGNQWAAWYLVPGWNTGGCDIRWAEAVALELATLWLAETDCNDICTIIHSDNTGVIDAFNKGSSQNVHCNDCLQWILVMLAVSNVSHPPLYSVTS